MREGVADFVRGGPGADTATVDAIDAVAADVETVDRPPGRSPLRRRPRRRHDGQDRHGQEGAASVKVSCPAGISGCNGSVTLRTAKGRTKTLGKAQLHAEGRREQDDQGQARQGHGGLAKNKKLAVNARTPAAPAPRRTAKVTLRFR